MRDLLPRALYLRRARERVVVEIPHASKTLVWGQYGEICDQPIG